MEDGSIMSEHSIFSSGTYSLILRTERRGRQASSTEEFGLLWFMLWRRAAKGG